ncbi:CS domain-containing protein [Colletotrichum orchidophilum]|uniref:CS domain-containing protein n=1 Tax=Colletotrichum orchidophilum TaxID=1209926 RepID=A0A1G4BK02_9PEZI|nr:CS domain-containing protein [Colletotrichum orchidophilum]OHF01761.1 CS domain-containing protein [Colletotrichum orchidophilum]
MSEYTAGAAGMTAIDKKDWDTAIIQLSKALKVTKSPKWLIGRSKAYIGTKDFRRALRDAELAYVAAAARNNRAFMADSQYRRAVAHLRLGELANADICAIWAQRMAEGKNMANLRAPEVDDKGYARGTRTALQNEITAVRQTEDPAQSKFGAIWNTICALRLQILGGLEKLAEDDEKRKVTVKFAPDVSLDAPDQDEVEEFTKEEIEAAKAEAVAKPQPKKEVRVDFFQSSATLTVSVFAKNIPKDAFKVDYGESEISMSHIPGHEPSYTIHLYSRIDPASSKHTVTANKVEFQLKKLEASKWPTLQRPADSAAAHVAEASIPKKSSSPPPPAAAGQTTAAVASAPAYPTSSKSGPKNWDKLEGIDDEDGTDGGDINAFFKTLYKGASPEARRAMMKSFTESNGTSLSTDWDDVKNRKVETVPPEGVEAKEWES